jgi:hypothetical protein
VPRAPTPGPPHLIPDRLQVQYLRSRQHLLQARALAAAGEVVARQRAQLRVALLAQNERLKQQHGALQLFISCRRLHD